MTVDTSKILAWDDLTSTEQALVLSTWNQSVNFDGLIECALAQSEARGLRLYDRVKAALERQYDQTGPHAYNRSAWLWREMHAVRTAVGREVWMLLHRYGFELDA